MADYQKEREEFERIGPEKVKENLRMGNVYSPARTTRAEGWLADHLLAKSEASQTEQIDIARSAKDAAWLAARAAERANTKANTANVIAIAALAVAMIAAAFAAWPIVQSMFAPSRGYEQVDHERAP